MPVQMVAQHWAKVADGLAHAVPAIVVAPGLNTPTVTFAAAGQIVRYPAGSGGSDSGGILSTLLLIVIVGAAAWFISGPLPNSSKSDGRPQTIGAARRITGSQAYSLQRLARGDVAKGR